MKSEPGSFKISYTIFFNWPIGKATLNLRHITKIEKINGFSAHADTILINNYVGTYNVPTLQKHSVLAFPSPYNLPQISTLVAAQAMDGL